MVCNKNLVEDEGKDIPMDKEIDSEVNKGLVMFNEFCI